MTTTPASQTIKPRRLKPVFLFFMVTAIAALFFLSRDGIDWRQTFESLTQPPASPPAKQAALPPPSVVLPSFDVVSADEAGTLIAAGKGPENATIRLQNAGQTLAETQADENGEWVLMLEKPLPAGTYVLSLQAVDPATHETVNGRRSITVNIDPHGKRFEARMQNATPAQSGPEAAKNVAAVKQGDTLWEIARRHFGDGTRYRAIVDANKERIKNPDLIYPKQQFDLPHN